MVCLPANNNNVRFVRISQVYEKIMNNSHILFGSAVPRTILTADLKEIPCRRDQGSKIQD